MAHDTPSKTGWNKPSLLISQELANSFWQHSTSEETVSHACAPESHGRTPQQHFAQITTLLCSEKRSTLRLHRWKKKTRGEGGRRGLGHRQLFQEQRILIDWLFHQITACLQHILEPKCAISLFCLFSVTFSNHPQRSRVMVSFFSEPTVVLHAQKRKLQTSFLLSLMDRYD